GGGPRVRRRSQSTRQPTGNPRVGGPGGFCGGHDSESFTRFGRSVFPVGLPATALVRGRRRRGRPHRRRSNGLPRLCPGVSSPFRTASTLVTGLVVRSTREVAPANATAPG